MIINNEYRIYTKSGKWIGFSFTIEDAIATARKGRGRWIAKKVKNEFIPISF